jgi:hypothetical protein
MEVYGVVEAHHLLSVLSPEGSSRSRMSGMTL